MAALTGLLLLAAGALHPSYAQSGAARFTADDTRAALSVIADPVLDCIVSAETGRSYNPMLISPTNDYGPAQLHQGGRQWREYMDGWGDDPFDPYTTLPYAEWAITHGEGPAWSTWSACL